jgi:hypothetical protein
LQKVRKLQNFIIGIFRTLGTRCRRTPSLMLKRPPLPSLPSLAAITRSTIAIASNTAAGLPNIASTDDTIADNCDDESDLGNDEDDPIADNCDDESDPENG